MYKKNGRNNEIFIMLVFYCNIHNVTKDGQDYRIFRLERFDRITGFSRFTGLNVLTGLQDFQDLQV